MSRWSDYSPERRAELKAYGVAWRAAHREQQKAYSANYRAAHREELKANKARYAGSHLEERRQDYVQNRAARRAYANTYQREVARFAQYGLTREMFDEYLDAQEGACAYCGFLLPPNISWIAIDHDHTTGHYRGLVHNRCNQEIGNAEAHFAGYMAAAG